jgi:hypothetical protein
MIRILLDRSSPEGAMSKLVSGGKFQVNATAPPEALECFQIKAILELLFGIVLIQDLHA